MIAIEMCAGAGGQALGLHNAGFEHEALIEIDEYACATLRENNQRLGLGWRDILEFDLKVFAEKHAANYQGRVDLLAGGVPCPPFSKAGMQLGHDDERDLFPTALECVRLIQPRAVMLENVPGLAERKFDYYREKISESFAEMGYTCDWRLLQASDFGVPQLRPRIIFVAFRHEYFQLFRWPTPTTAVPVSVGDALYDLMSLNGWNGAANWRLQANKIAPTLVGGSKKHGGPDLGPTRAKAQWKNLGVNAHRVGNDSELPDQNFRGVLSRDGSIREGFENLPLLTLRMAARIQGFPDNWNFSGTKTHAYRQIGNAFPPPVAQAVASEIYRVLEIANNNREVVNG